MMNKKIEDAFSKHLNAELYSAYLYLSMSAWLESTNMKGMANWMRVQAQEEMVHVMKFYAFILDRGGKVKLTAIEGPKGEWKSTLEVFEDAYKHECKVSALIADLVTLAEQEHDRPADTFLQWFVNEQVEEEKSALEVADKLKLVGDNGAALFMIDNELGARVFVPPATAQ
jgi:ferritin